MEFVSRKVPSHGMVVVREMRMELPPIVNLASHQRQEEITVKQDPTQTRALHNVIPPVLLQETRVAREAMRDDHHASNCWNHISY